MRIVRETGKPIAQVARDLGIDDGTLQNWVKKDRETRDGAGGGLAEDERAELARLQRERRAGEGAWCPQAICGPLVQGSDGR